MGILAAFWGFVIGAAIGTIATASTAQELRDEASQWDPGARWKAFLDRKARGFPAFLSTALDLLQIEILFLLLVIWLSGLIWVIFLTPSWDNQSYLRYIIGSVVGTAAAPWIWLHFSRSFGTEKSDAETEAESNQLKRYQFVTFMLGAAILIAIVQPYLATWLPRANKIEGFGVAFNFSAPRNERGQSILQVGQPSTGSASTSAGRLASATSRAHLVSTGHEKQKPGGPRKFLKDVDDTLEGFSDLSVMDRDRVYIAYFLHERFSTGQGTFKNLADYVQKAKEAQVREQYRTSDQIRSNLKPDQEFLDSLADLSECISLYAENLRDFRLFLVDSNDLLRTLLVNVASQWAERSKASKSDSDRPATDAISDLSKVAGKLAQQVVDALRNADIPSKVCGDEMPKALQNKRVDTREIGKTPYPAYLIAHYMAAIDSVESGMLVMRDWLSYQSRKNGSFDVNDPEQSWYTIRAMLTSSQLPYRFGSSFPPHQALVRFHQETTDRIGAMLKVHDALTWRALCRRLDNRGLHSQIGKYLAFTYADERNYLFELLRPEDYGLPPPGESALISTEVSPESHLEEAEAILQASDCFSGVPRFDRRLIGQYRLNAAQLRYAIRMSKEGDEKSALTKQIRADLERAKQLETKQEQGDVLDLLRQSDEFEPHRARLARFRRALDNEGDKD